MVLDTRRAAATLSSRGERWTVMPKRWRSASTPAELVGFEKQTKQPQMLDFLRYLADRCPRTVRLSEIGRSELGLPIYTVRLRASGAAAERPRVLICAQQHGNEPAGKEAALLLARDLAGGPLRLLLDHLEIWIVPQLNPEGAATGRRRTCSGQDLNRGHHVLASPEHLALYRLFHQVMPHVTLDLHEFHTERNSFGTDRTLCAYDLMADGPTNLNTSPELRDLGQRALDVLGERLEDKGFAYHRYMRLDGRNGGGPEGLRYSTLGAYDGRNVPALFGSLAFILESTRRGKRQRALERRTRATYAAAQALLEFAAKHSRCVMERTVTERTRGMATAGSPVALRARYEMARQSPPLCYAYQRPETGESGQWVLHQARTESEVTVQRTLPSGYWLDLDADDERLTRAVAILRGHRIALHRLAEPRSACVETYRVLRRVSRKPKPGEAGADPAVVIGSERRELPAGSLLVPTAQPGGLLAALLFEPESMDGLVANREWRIEPGDEHPAKRVLAHELSWRVGTE